MWRKGNPPALLGMQNGAAIVENSMMLSQKFKNRTALCSNSTSRNIFEETQNTNSKEYMHPMFIAALFTVAKIWKQPRCPSVDEWIKKNCDTFT